MTAYKNGDSNLPRITLRPPPHRDYLQGYPGIPPTSLAPQPDPKTDPLVILPHLDRPQAALTGTVEVRGQHIRAKWLSVELEKIEVVPPQDHADSKRSNRKVDSDPKYVELIGTGPSKLWEAGQGTTATNGLRPVLSISTSGLYPPTSTRKKGLRGVFSRAPRDTFQDDQEVGVDSDGYEVIPEGSYPFSIPLPEGLPPTLELDAHGGKGISYQIVASLSTKPKKTRLKSNANTVCTASASTYLHKADILPSWPAYAPLLPLPLPSGLPWRNSTDKPTLGETREATLTLQDRGDSTTTKGQVWIKATREMAAFGPGDEVRLWVQIGWGGERPLRLTRIDAVLRETLTYRYPSTTSSTYLVRATPKVSTLFSTTTPVSRDPENDPSGFALLYQHESVAYSLQGTVPIDWRKMTVRTAKHIDIGYHLKVRAMLEGGDEISIDYWPVVVANIPIRTANGIIREIGWVDGLCDRPGVAQKEPDRVTAPFMPEREETPMIQRGDSGAELPSRVPFHVTNPSHDDDDDDDEPSPMAGFVPSTRAREEKLRYYEQATRTRDALQSSLRASTQSGSDPRMSYDDARSPTIAPESPSLAAQVQHATLATMSRSHLQPLERSMTTVAWSGSDTGATPPPASTSTSAATALLGRTLTVAEAEKARLFDDARETARQRQDEARQIADAQPADLLADFQAAQDAFEQRLVAEAEQERRLEEERLKSQFEAAERARIAAEEEQWRREEEARRARALAELDEKKRRAEQALADELRRFEEQRRLEDRQRAEELEVRRREDDLKRQRAEEMRRLDKERERAEEARRHEARLAEMRAREAEEARRRQQEDDLRRQAEARAREEQQLYARQEEARQEQTRQEQTRQEQTRQEQTRQEQTRQEQTRQEEARRQANEASELEQLRAAQRRLLEEREELMRALAAQNSPPAAVHSPQPVSPLVRAPSVVSFAPSMSAANATAEAYAQAIAASSSSSGMSDEKAEYLRQLRQRTLAAVPNANGPAYPTMQPSCLTRHDTLTSTSVVSTLPPMSAVSSAPPAELPPTTAQTPYKTAAEEKEEAAARQRAQDAAAAAATSAASVPAPNADEDLPPSYPVPGAGTSSSVTTRPNASEEKAELERYYAAKAAVDAHQASPTPMATSGPAYPTMLRQNGTAPPPPVAAPMTPASEESAPNGPRDPAISAGKRAASPSIGRGSASMAPSPVVYAPEPHHASAYELAPSQYGSFGLGSFPGYESLSEQIERQA